MEAWLHEIQKEATKLQSTVHKRTFMPILCLTKNVENVDRLIHTDILLKNMSNYNKNTF